MALVVFDSWALLATWVASRRVTDRVGLARGGAAISSVNLGEVLYIRMRHDGERSALATVEQIRGLIEVIDPDWPLVSRAATVEAGGGLSYADAFCVATALRAEAPLWTGDSEIVVRAAEHSCEVVDLRS